MSVDVVFRRVADVFLWASDLDTTGLFEHWGTFTDNVRDGVISRRDCDDFALTALELGIEDYGWDRDKCRVARVLTESGDTSKPFDHAIAIYDGMILDNRQRGPVPVDWPSYKFYDFSELPLTEWKLYQSGIEFNNKGHW